MVNCWFCNQKYVNDYHLAAAHTKAYHDLIRKIHAKIDLHSKFDTIYDDGITQLMKYLLEDEK